MSRYTDIRDRARADRYSHPDELHYALEMNADDFLVLWESANDIDYAEFDRDKDPYALYNAVEALRPLFGEEDGNQ